MNEPLCCCLQYELELTQLRQQLAETQRMLAETHDRLMNQDGEVEGVGELEQTESTTQEADPLKQQQQQQEEQKDRQMKDIIQRSVL